QGVDPCEVPDVGAVAPAVAEPERISVGSGADLEHEHQLMLGAIEGPHAGISFVPDAEVLELGEHRLTGLEQFSHVAPVHAYERNSSVAGEGCSMSERTLQEAGEGGDRHLAGPHGEFAMADTAESGHMPVDWNVVGWIGEDEVGPFGS